MKFKKLLALSLLLSTPAFAVGIQLLSVRNAYNSTNVSSTAWTKIVTSAPYPINNLTAYDSSGVVVKLGTGVSSGTVASQLFISPSTTSYYRVAINQGDAVWLETVSTTATTGEIDLNFSW